MTKPAAEVMQEIMVAAVLDAVGALKAASKGLPNNLLRDLGSIHPNTTFADLPKEVQASITASARAAFNRLLKEGYSVSTDAPSRPGPPRRDAPGVTHRPRHPPGSRGGPGKPRQPGRPGRPGGPKPRGPR